jgi:hypothetical protein
MTDPWTDVAWNGVTFRMPARLQPAKIGHRYLLFEDDQGPRLELKWDHVKGRFVPQTQLKRLTSAAGKSFKNSITRIPLPARWQRALPSFENALGFAWQGISVSGKGVILYCSRCQTATMIQFYQRRHTSPAIDQRVLASFRDHHRGPEVGWQLFDIRALIPQSYQLTRFRFEPGEFELVFSSPKGDLTLYRWSPASIILSRHRLTEMADAMGSDYQLAVQTKTWQGHEAVQGMSRKQATSLRYWWEQIRRKPLFNWLQLWHIADRNRILGLHAESRRPPDQPLMESICQHYEVV